MTGRELGGVVVGALAARARPRPPADATPPPPRPTRSWPAPRRRRSVHLAQSDSGDAGRCTARAIEIRRGAVRTPVPLLYTYAAPEIVNDTLMRARLSDHCRPGDSYLVDLRTGRPVRERS
jgi:hypothetical protein